MIEQVIEPSRGLVRIPWREIWQYRDLLSMLVRRDVLAKYKQTVLGPAWFVIQPLLTTLVFTVVFGKVARIPTDGLPPILFYLCGMLAWGYFAQCMNGASMTFVGNAHLFGKVYFPRLIVPLALVLSNLIAFLIQLLTFGVLWAAFKFTSAASAYTATPAALLFPLLVVHTAAIALGVGLWMTSMTAKYRDFAHLSGFLTQLWLYATPVVYPLSAVPEKWRWVSALNPMTVVVESYRQLFLGVGTVEPRHVALSVAVTAVVLISGLVVFTRVERTFIDTV